MQKTEEIPWMRVGAAVGTVDRGSGEGRSKGAETLSTTSSVVQGVLFIPRRDIDPTSDGESVA